MKGIEQRVIVDFRLKIEELKVSGVRCQGRKTKKLKSKH